MSVSVVIPTTLAHDGVASTIRQALCSAKRLGNGAEVILVANGQGHEKPLPVPDSPSLKILRLERANAAGARNAGISTASNEAVIFTDDDCIVPPNWCRDMHQALNIEGELATAAPVRLIVKGPVSAFINHLRVFDAPPLNAERVHTLVTANCGFRRDRAPPDIRFDDVNYNNAGEDTDFGLRLADTGDSLRWLASSAPIEHALSENINEITERFMRYGRGNARLYIRSERWRESVPGAHEWYADIVKGSHADYRRFVEIGHLEIKALFETYNLILVSSFLIGYLEELGTHLGHKLVRIELDSLDLAWRDLEESLICLVRGRSNIDWRNLPLNYARLNDVHPRSYRAVQAVSHVLRQYAAPEPDLPADIARALFAWSAEFEAYTSQINRSLLREWTRLNCARNSYSEEDVEFTLRSIGATFCDGCHDIEKMIHAQQTRVHSQPVK